MLVRLKRFQTDRSRLLQSLLGAYAGNNVFNPSFQYFDSKIYVAFRHFGSSNKPPFEGSLVEYDPQSGRSRCLSLTAHARGFGLRVVADPKLLVLDRDLWVTFNDGWSSTGNHLYLMRVAPTLSAPLECSFSGRRTVEKNWSFSADKGKLRALYSIHPWRVLQADMPANDARSIQFTEDEVPYHFSIAGRAALEELSIGTQAVTVGNSTYIVAHEKIHITNYRAYLGRFIRVHWSNGQGTMHVSEKRLCHSLPALLGSRTRHNRNLLSCTYFSGLAIEGGRAVLGYGINDTSFGFAELPISHL